MTQDEYCALSALDIAAKVTSGKVSAKEVTQAALARIEATEPVVNAFIHVDAEGALKAADMVDQRIARGEAVGPLAGVPTSVKDLIHVAGMPTSFGSTAYAGRAAPGDAVPVARLRQAGAVILGKTTTPEFGHKAITESPLFGRTPNPYNPAHTSGGSSGGAAASVAARQTPISVGSDGGGSVRIPSSVCGLYGLKPTLGRIPHVHAGDLFGNNSFIGPMTQSLEDLRAMYGVMAGSCSGDPWSKSLPVPLPVERPRIGFAMLTGNPAIDPEVEKSIQRAVNVIAQQGFEIEPVSIDLASYESAFLVILESILAGRAAADIAQMPDKFDSTLIRTVERGQAHSAVELNAAINSRSKLYRELESLFERIDYLVTPTLAVAALPIDTDPHADVCIAGTNCGRIRAAWYPYTFAMNLTGHPAMTVPCGWTSQNLPVGLHIAGRWYEEDGLLDFASRVVPAIEFETRLPDA